MKRSRSPAGDEAAEPGAGRYAITFGEVAILHVGGAETGCGRRETGFSVASLRDIQSRLTERGVRSELCDLSQFIPESIRSRYPEDSEAATLLIRNGADVLLGRKGAADELLSEQRSVAYDRKYFDARMRCTKNKRARYNVVFADEGHKHSEDFTQCTVQKFDDVPLLQAARRALPELLGADAADLNAEGNHYYADKCGIGFHGDSERKIVVCLSLGDSSTLRYHWRRPGTSLTCSKPADLQVHHGDVYVMSEKATGWDWRMRSRLRLVHAAGASKYLRHLR